MKRLRNLVFRPFIAAALTFVFLGAIIQFAVYERSRVVAENSHVELHEQLDNVRDRIKTILSQNISSANALAVIYKQYGFVKDFESVADELMRQNDFIDFIQFTNDSFVIVKVYPNTNAIALGKSLLDHPRFREEALIALRTKEIHFSGPYKMLLGPTAIAGRVPVFSGGKFIGLSIVVTKLETIQERIVINRHKFIFQIEAVNPITRQKEHFFWKGKVDPATSKSVSIPEANWVLTVAYAPGYKKPSDLYLISLFGMLLSFMSAAVVYSNAKKNVQLEKMVQIKTHSLNERIKELSTIYQVNELLKEEGQEAERIMDQLVEILPNGWQYEDCCAKIIFDGKTYTSKNYSLPIATQQAEISLIDGRTGTIQVGYVKEHRIEHNGPFLDEEQHLIDTIADTIAVYFNKVAQQRQLRKSEARFRGAFEHAAIGMSLMSPEGQWLMVNPALSLITGYSEEELLRLSFQDITHKDDLQNSLTTIPRLVSGEAEYYRGKKRYVHKNGQTVWVNINVATIKDEYGKLMYFVTQVEDVSEMVESQMKFRDLVERSLVGVYIVQDGKLAYANPRIIQDFGYSEQELYSMPIEHLIYLEDQEKVRSNMASRLRGDTEEARYEARVVSADREIIWVEMLGAITMFSGKPAIIGTMVDITRKKILELEQQKIISDLTQKNRDLEQFSHILSHNVRAPISTMLGLIDVYNSFSEPAEKQAALDGIDQSVHKLEHVIRDLNDILSVKNALSEVKSKVNLQSLLEEVKSLLDTTIRGKEAKIIANFGDVTELYTIRAYITSIFYNIVANSLKYAHPGRIPEISISGIRLDEQIVQLRFTDNGIGIDTTKNQSKLFGLYNRFNFTVEGRGLGLFMVKTQVEALKGTIELSSELDKGTDIYIRLPL
ncbi:MAG: PAS domain S-box protein [Sphingobacteriales bacterium]|nr:MAG: PAS domain S-box protein [Sphingobacteriales bacterium]